MSKESNFLTEHPMGYLATIDETNKPRVRGWGLIKAEQERIVLGTSNNKEVFKQLKTNLNAEFIATSKNMTTLRVSGDVVFEKNRNIVFSVIENNPVIKRMYAGKEDQFELFYLTNLQYKWFESKMTLKK